MWTLDGDRSESQSVVLVICARARVLGALWCLSAGPVHLEEVQTPCASYTLNVRPSLSYVQRARLNCSRIRSIDESKVATELLLPDGRRGMIERRKGKRPLLLITPQRG